MANKLAGQRAKFSRARAIFYSSDEEQKRQRAIQLMAEVLADAPLSGFSETDVTQGEDVPAPVRERAPADASASRGSEDDADTLINALAETVDISDVLGLGQGHEWVYCYGYACAPDRLKIGCTTGDVVARIAAQISTATPDRPVLKVRIATHDCHALERVLHGILRLRQRKVDGAGAEWFVATREEVVAIYKSAVSF